MTILQVFLNDPFNSVLEVLECQQVGKSLVVTLSVLHGDVASIDFYLASIVYLEIASAVQAIFLWRLNVCSFN